MAQVVRADLFRVRLPLVHTFRTSSHSKNTLDHILVRLTDRQGQVGWGECASPADPYYGPENIDTCWAILSGYLVPTLLGKSWERPEEATQFGARIRGNNFAKAAVDIACWDLWTRANKVPLATAIGATQSTIEAGVSLGIEPTVDALLEQVAMFLDQGYLRIKLKIAPGWDVEPVRVVRETFGDIPLQVDANAVYADDTATMNILRELDRFGLAMIEQPYAEADLLAHARAQRALATPLCLDESITSLEAARLALELSAARILNLKVSRLGGVTAAVAMHRECFERNVGLWCGGMHEFGVGRAANIAVAALPGFGFPSDISGSDKYYSRDVVTPVIVATDGRVRVPYDRIGIGYETDAAMVAEYSLQTETFEVRG